jgi:multidrug efflux pump subunit AcrB
VLARLLSMLCVLAVFVPSFFMNGVGRQLFVPLSLAVGFAMFASYFLSSSLVPVFATWIMKESHKGKEKEGSFGRLRTHYERYLTFVLDRRWPVILGYFAVTALILVLIAPRIGSEIFPDSNGPVLRMRLKAPIGTRIEETEPTVLPAIYRCCKAKRPPRRIHSIPKTHRVDTMFIHKRVWFFLPLVC